LFRSYAAPVNAKVAAFFPASGPYTRDWKIGDGDVSGLNANKQCRRKHFRFQRAQLAGLAGPSLACYSNV